MEEKDESSNQLKGFVYLAIVLMILWGFFGLLSGDGFFGGIGKSFDAIGDLIALFLKLAVGAGIIWAIFEFLKKREEKKKNQ